MSPDDYDELIATLREQLQVLQAEIQRLYKLLRENGINY